MAVLERVKVEIAGLERGRLAPPKTIGGYSPSLPTDEELQDLLTGKRMPEKCPRLFPKLPARTWHFLIILSRNFFELEDRVAVNLGIKAHSNKPLFSPGLEALGDALEMLIDPQAEVSPARSFSWNTRPIHPSFPDSLTSSLCLPNQVKFIIFPQPLRFFLDENSRPIDGLNGLTKEEAARNLSLRRRDSEWVRGQLENYTFFPPYIALEGSSWRLQVFLEGKNICYRLLSIEDPSFSKPMAEYSEPFSAPGGERLFSRFCQDIVSHLRKSQIMTRKKR